jgi:hypothetical protein
VSNLGNPENRSTIIPLFPVTALPTEVSDMCRAVSDNMQVPLELPATVALGVLAACCQNKVVVRIGADYIEPLNLFTLAIAQSGERKSPVFRILTAPVYVAQDDYTEIHMDEIARSKRDYSLLKKQLEEAERSFAKEGKSEIGERIHELDAQLRSFTPLTAPKLLLDDVTSEKLIDVLDEQGGSVTIASAEGGLFISLKNKAAMNATFDVYLKAYSGDSIDVKRIGREGNSIKNPRLSLILTCQTDVAKDMITNPTFREKGLPARFLYATCRSSLGNRIVDTPDISQAVKSEYDALIRRLLDYALDTESPNYELTLSEEGRNAYYDYSSFVEEKLGADGDYSHMTDWCAKLVGQMMRIAGIISVCEGRTSIDADIIGRACELADWFAVNADVLFKTPATKIKERESNEQYLLRKLMNWDSDKEMTVSNARKRTQNKKDFDFEGALDELKQQGYIKIVKHGKSQVIVIIS